MTVTDFVIEDHVPAPASNEYDGAVAKLIEAGEGKRIALPAVAVEDEQKARRRFGEAANRAGKSPKLITSEPSSDGKTVVLRYALVKLREYTKKTEEAPAAEA